MDPKMPGWINVEPTLGRVARTAVRRFARKLAESEGVQEPSSLKVRFLGKTDSAGRDAQGLRVSLALLFDLKLQGWVIQVNRSGVWCKAPEPGRCPQDEKDRLRQTHLHERDSQLRQRSTREFIRRMERQHLGPNGWASIFSVMRDGCEFASQLRTAALLPEGPKRLAHLNRCIAPYIQFVEADARCALTGMKLGDIWRYFRHTWTNPYNSTPGRKIWMLIRDAAPENHPVIGIAAIGSAVIQFSARDKWIGWRSEEFLEQLRLNPSAKWARWLHKFLHDLIAGVYRKDFVEDSLLTGSELRIPTEACIAALLRESAKARKRHQKYPKRGEHKGSGRLPRRSWRTQTQLDLFRAKRAETLAELLTAKLKLQQAGFRGGSRSELKKIVESAAGRRAIEIVLKHVKASHVGIDMLDITVCGAVPPYNEVLGGKLVSLLLASPEIVQTYARRYARTPSVIASSMAGRPVRRAPKLVLLGTTSLYNVNPSQYNRLRIEAREVGGEPDKRICFQRLGQSEGFGSYHISQETVREIDAMLAQSHPGTRVNSIFGEGVNPRLRKLRAGVDMLGLNSNALLNHRSARVVYGVSLASNFREVLLGLTSRPRYIFPQDNPKEVSRRIADFWMRRWLAGRIKNEIVLERLSTNSLAHPVQHGARVALPAVAEESILLPDGQCAVAVPV